MGVHCCAGLSLVSQGAGDVLHCSARTSHCCGLPAGAWALWTHGLLVLTARDSVAVAPRLSSGGTQASLLCGTQDLPRSGIKLMSPALAG